MSNILKFMGTNMDIDLTTNNDDITWDQDLNPWNKSGDTNIHKCAIKKLSICKYFCGIEYLDKVLRSYPNNNSNVNNKRGNYV